MAAAIYCRVSTKAQAEEGSSLDSQEEHCRRLAESHNFKVEYVFREDWPGESLDRPELTRLRDLLRSGGVSAVVAHATDRLARNPIHLAIMAEECEKAGASLLFVTEPLDSSPEGQLIRYVRGFAAQIEREKIKERTVRGRRERARTGKLPTGGAGLYGYDYIRGHGEGEGVRVINQAEAEVVRAIFRWLVEEDLTLGRIAIRLTEQGVPSPKGTSRWGRSTVGRLVRQEGYMGKTYAFRYQCVPPKNPVNGHRRYKNSRHELRPSDQWVELPGATPAIVSADLFQAAQETLARHARMSPRNVKAQYLLRGHVFCGECGRSYYGTPDHGYRYYRCAGKQRIISLQRCSNRTVNAEQLEELVWEQLAHSLKNPGLILGELERRQHSDGTEDFKERLAVVDRRLASLDTRQARLVRLYSFAELDDAAIEGEVRAVKRERERLQEERRRLEQRLADAKLSESSLISVRDYCQRVAKNLETFGFEEKRLAIEALQVRVVVEEAGSTIEGAIPSCIESLAS